MGFIARVFRRRSSATDADAEALAAIRKHRDLALPIVLRHFLYFALEYEARMVAAELETRGFTSELKDAPMNSGVLVLARRAETLDDATIHNLRAELRKLALSQKGEYDGWEAELGAGETIPGASARNQ